MHSLNTVKKQKKNSKMCTVKINLITNVFLISQKHIKNKDIANIFAYLKSMRNGRSAG